MVMHTFSLPTPVDFRFWAVVSSHGWCELPPFSYEGEARSLSRLHRLADGNFAHITATATSQAALSVTVEGLDEQPTRNHETEISALLRRCLSIEHDIGAFHALVSEDPDYRWIARVGAGRMLVGGTVWEDLAKTLLTTNTTWAMTIGMVTRLNSLGDTAPNGEHVFPTPAQIASLTPEALNQHVRAGYRGAYLHTLAENIATGKFDAEALRDPLLTSKDVYRQLKSIKGFGDYAAGAMMRLLGRFDELGLDSECRRVFVTRFNDGQPASDKQIAAHYARFGTWRGLVVWMDVMRQYLLDGLDGDKSA